MPEPTPPRPIIELLYFTGCPHHEVFLPHLRDLLRLAGIDTPVDLVEITSDEEALHQRFLGLPTLRVNGVDVDPSAAHRADYGMQCRLYPTRHGLRGTPADEWILNSLVGGTA